MKKDFLETNDEAAILISSRMQTADYVNANNSEQDRLIEKAEEVTKALRLSKCR